MSVELKTTAVADPDNPVACDLHLENGQLVLVDGAEGIAQHIRNRLQLFRGEWFVDLRVGMPYFEELFVKNPDLDVLRTLFREAIQGTPGVSSVPQTDVRMDRVNRSATVTFTAVLDTDELITSDSFAPFIVEF